MSYFLNLGLPSLSISVDTIEICLIIDGTSCRSNQARVENPNWNLSLRSFGERIATHLAAKRDGSRKKDRAVREGLRIGFDVLKAGNVRDLKTNGPNDFP